MMRKADNRADAARQAGEEEISRQALFGPLLAHTSRRLDHESHCVAADGWFSVDEDGYVFMHAKRIAPPESWVRMIALALVSLGFSGVRQRKPQDAWELAVLLCADHFCHELRLGVLPESLEYQRIAIPSGGPESLFRQFCADGIAPDLLDWYLALRGGASSLFLPTRSIYVGGRRDWQALLADGIRLSVGSALRQVGNVPASGTIMRDTKSSRARRKLIDNYPLLGALAAEFMLEEDPRLCQQQGIQVAAIHVQARKIWMNPAAGLSEAECLFVLAHELLHAGLAHASRRRGREPYLWNVACDFVINGWLIDMRLGAAPGVGLLYDATFAGCSAEDVYDQLARDLRRARKLATLRGVGEMDVLDETGPALVSAEDFCRRALLHGLERTLLGGKRGLLPAGLVEEIRALAQPPVPWDTRLADWFDHRFPQEERPRTYARPSRRQSASPDIPRPALALLAEERRRSRVFGVVVDTSGSMSPVALGKGVGAIASYAMARDVYAVRLVFCDAQAHDAGWVEPESLLDRVSVRGRGGTTLQPGIDCLHRLAAKGEFPPGGPVLVITDGFCEDRLTVLMDHAYLLAEGGRLPFSPRGPVFHVS